MFFNFYQNLYNISNSMMKHYWKLEAWTSWKHMLSVVIIDNAYFSIEYLAPFNCVDYWVYNGWYILNT